MTVECDDSNVGTAQETTQYQVESDESPAMAVVRAVATASGRSQVETNDVTDALDPLAESIDPEALDAVFESRGDAAEEATVVEFQYCGHQVAVKGGETVCVAVQ